MTNSLRKNSHTLHSSQIFSSMLWCITKKSIILPWANLQVFSQNLSLINTNQSLKAKLQRRLRTFYRKDFSISTQCIYYALSIMLLQISCLISRMCMNTRVATRPFLTRSLVSWLTLLIILGKAQRCISKPQYWWILGSYTLPLYWQSRKTRKTRLQIWRKRYYKLSDILTLLKKMRRIR